MELMYVCRPTRRLAVRYNSLRQGNPIITTYLDIPTCVLPIDYPTNTTIRQGEKLGAKLTRTSEFHTPHK